MNNDNIQLQRERADQLCLPMFMLALLFLVFLAAIIVTWIDIPRVAELATIEALDHTEENSQFTVPAEVSLLVAKAYRIGRLFTYGLLILWPLFWLEFLLNVMLRRGSKFQWKAWIHPVIVCLLPPLRLGATSPAWGDRIWLPLLSWQHTGKPLSRRLERFFGKPMLVIALLILPILLIELVFKSAVQEYSWLRLILHISTGFIWLAFTVEFIIMVSATDKKLAYVKKHWIDLAIILLPLVSFLRTIRALRIARLAKIQKLAKLSRVYRLRGLGMKAMRALLLYEAVNRLLRITPEKKLAKLREEYDEREEELAELLVEINALEAQTTQKEQQTSE